MKLHQLINYDAIQEKFGQMERPIELPRLRFSQIARAS
jgi:hypothetical protein